jgi:hypothetical protein
MHLKTCDPIGLSLISALTNAIAVERNRTVASGIYSTHNLASILFTTLILPRSDSS